MAEAHRDVAKAFASGYNAKGSSMFTNGKTIWSWGYHFPIAHKVNGVILFNIDKYSSSTSSHQTYVRGELDMKDVVDCDTKTISRVVNISRSGDNSNNDVIIIEKVEEPHDVEEALEFLKVCLKKKGLHGIVINKLFKPIHSRMLVEAL